RQRVRKAMYRQVLKGCKQSDIEEAAHLIGQRLAYNDCVVKALMGLAEQGAVNVVVTASPRLVVETILKAVNLPIEMVIGTELQFSNGHFTGELLGPECVKAEK